MVRSMKSVLIVEDDVIVALDIQSRIEKMGYNVIGRVASGRKALNKITETRLDLVFMDIVLKGEMDGIKARGSYNETTTSRLSTLQHILMIRHF